MTGGQAGDQVLLLTRRDGRLVQEGRRTLDAGAQIRFELARAEAQPGVRRTAAGDRGTRRHGRVQVTVDGPRR